MIKRIIFIFYNVDFCGVFCLTESTKRQKIKVDLFANNIHDAKLLQFLHMIK